MVQPVVPNQDLPLMHHILTMSYLVSLVHITYMSNSSKLVGNWGGLSVGVRMSSLALILLSLTKIRIFQVSPQRASLVHASRLANLGGSAPFGAS